MMTRLQVPWFIDSHFRQTVYFAKALKEWPQVEMEMSSDVKELINRSYRHFEAGEFADARHCLDEAHALDFENAEVRSALRACGFWQQRSNGLQEISGDEQRGDYLRRQWRRYDREYSLGLEHSLKDGNSRLKIWVHSTALESYEKQLTESSDPGLLLKVGRCQKVLGRYEKSLSTLERALREAGDSDARLLAELGDTYALVGETKAAKVLLREALFTDARALELDEMASPLFPTAD